MEYNNLYDGIVIPAYLINLKERKDLLEHIKEQFNNKAEFQVNIVECKNEIGAVGLWQTIVKIVSQAKEQDNDVILICAEDHKFSESYSKQYLFKNIIEAHEQGANLLLGGVANYGHGVPIAKNRCWVDRFWGNQFIIIFNKFFQQILDEPFSEEDEVNIKLSEMTSNKMVLYPFVSIKKDSDYGNPFRNVQFHDQTYECFQTAENRLAKIISISNKYCSHLSYVLQ